MFKLGLPTVALIGLSACGGTSVPLDFLEITEQGSEISETIRNIPYSDPSTLPMTRTATYNGFIAAKTSSTTAVGGRLELTADFSGSGDISGRAYQIVDNNDVKYSGELNLTNSLLDRNANAATHYTYTADLDGTLSGGGNTVSVDAELLGDFTGLSYEYVEGVIRGSAIVNGNRVSLTDGIFVGER